MAKNEIEIVVDADTKKAEKKLKGFGKALDAVGDIAKNAIGVALGVGLTKIPGLISGAIDSVGDLVDGAMDLEQAQLTFDALTESIGESSDAMMIDLREATRGMVADTELMEAANKLMAMGLADTSDEAADLTEMATQLGLAMGTDATTAMEDFALMLANESIPRLDTFGISSSTVRARILELIESGEALDRSEAFKMAVLEEGAKTMEILGDQSDTTKGQVAEFETGIDNIKNAIGTALMDAFGPLAEKLMVFITDHLPDIQEAIGTAGDAFAVWVDEQLPAVEQFLANDLGPALEDAIQWLGEDLPVAIDNFGQAWDDISGTLKTTADTIKTIVDFLETLEAFFESGWGSFGEDLRALLGIKPWKHAPSQQPDTSLEGYQDAGMGGRGQQQTSQEGYQDAGIGDRGPARDSYTVIVNRPQDEDDIIADFAMLQAISGAR